MIAVDAQLAKRKCITSPSLTTYSLPSSRILPASLAPTSPPSDDVVVVGDRLGADEALLEVGVNDAGRLRRLGAARDGPGARLLRADGEVGDEVQQLVAGADQAVEARLLEAHRRRGTRRGHPAAGRRTRLSILAEMTTRTAPSALARSSTFLEIGVAVRGRALPRRCTRRRRASTSAVAAPGRRASPRPSTSARRAGLPSRSRISAFSMTANCDLGLLVAAPWPSSRPRRRASRGFRDRRASARSRPSRRRRADRCGSRRG